MQQVLFLWALLSDMLYFSGAGGVALRFFSGGFFHFCLNWAELRGVPVETGGEENGAVLHV